MSKLVIVDAGHGLRTLGKRTPNLVGLPSSPSYLASFRYIPEWEGNQRIAKFLVKELIRCGITVKRVDDVTGATDVPLANRTYAANKLGADFYVSLHHNAGGGTGLETFSYPSSSISLKASKIILEELMKSGVPRRNRGAKTANFQVLRETKMPAVLIEYGFMDYAADGYKEAWDMLNDSVAKKQAVATAKGICRFLGVKYVPETVTTPVEPKPSKMYRLEIEGEPEFDTAYQFDVICSKIKSHLEKGKDGMIKIYPRVDEPTNS